MAQEVEKLALCKPALTLGYVRRDRHCGPLQLRRQPETFAFWKLLRNSIDFYGQSLRFLPDKKIFEKMRHARR